MHLSTPFVMLHLLGEFVCILCFSCLPGFAKDLRANAERMSFEDMEKMFTKTQGKLLTDKAWCVVHKDFCLCEPADIHVAGTPCIAWSTFGRRSGASGPTLLCFMVWVYQRPRDRDEQT